MLQQLAESSVAGLSAALDKSEENAVSSQLPASKWLCSSIHFIDW